MHSTLKFFLQSQIAHHEKIIADANLSRDKQKSLMSNGTWTDLPKELSASIYSAAALKQVCNFIEFHPNCIEDEGATNHQKLEHVVYDFLENYEKWLEANQASFNVARIVENFKPSDQFRDEEFFKSLTSLFIHRYIALNYSDTPRPEAA